MPLQRVSRENQAGADKIQPESSDPASPEQLTCQRVARGRALYIQRSFGKDAYVLPVDLGAGSCFLGGMLATGCWWSRRGVDLSSFAGTAMKNFAH